jgi:hypothetical protein
LVWVNESKENCAVLSWYASTDTYRAANLCSKRCIILTGLVGGAYSNPASEGFFLRYKSLVAAAKSQDVDLAVFVLSYGEAVFVARMDNLLNLSQRARAQGPDTLPN